jgi:hypothetical protein
MASGARETQRTHGNGLITTRTYDRDDNLVIDIRVETSLSANDRTGLSFNYSESGYDANKNVLKETTGAPMAGYSWTTAGGATSAYDDEDRLTYWERTSGATTSLEWPQYQRQQRRGDRFDLAAKRRQKVIIVGEVVADARRPQPSGHRAATAGEQHPDQQHRQPPAIASMQPGRQPVAPLDPLLRAFPTTFAIRHPWLSCLAACPLTAA